MDQRSPSSNGRPGNRNDSTRPPRTRRGGDRAAYPGARTSHTGAGARGSRAPAGPGGASTASRRRPARTPSMPTPATVWTCGQEPIDAHQRWPVPIVEAIATAFTTPGAHVRLVTAEPTSPAASTEQTDAATTTNTASVQAALGAVRALERTADTVALDTPKTSSGAPSRPFWADMLTHSVTPTATASQSPTSPAPHTIASTMRTTEAPGAERADLVVVSLTAHAVERVPLDQLALLAAESLRCGGILAVYTHSDWTQGRLVDPTGPIVAACQNADLLYLQHIVALHTPIREQQLHATPTPAVAAEYDRTRHRAHVRGLPAPHLRAHSDLLLFSQPQTPVGSPPPQVVSATSTHDVSPVSADRV